MRKQYMLTINMVRQYGMYIHVYILYACVIQYGINVWFIYPDLGVV